MAGVVPASFDLVLSMQWMLDRNVQTLESPMARSAQRTIRGGDRWRTTLTLTPTGKEQLGMAGQVNAWLSELSRGDTFTWLTPQQNSVAGNWSPPERVANGRFNTDASSWTAVGSSIRGNSGRILVATLTGQTSGYASQSLTVESGKPHAISADARPGITTGAYLQANTTAGGAQEFSNSVALIGPYRLTGVWSPASAASTIILGSTGAGPTGTYFDNASVCRCLQVSAASQTGNRLTVTGGPASINSALLAGEYVSVLLSTDRWQMVQLLEDFDSASDGTGYISFEPALRASPAASAPIIVRNPFCKMRLSKAQAGSTITAPITHGFTIELEEDIS